MIDIDRNNKKIKYFTIIINLKILYLKNNDKNNFNNFIFIYII